MTVERGDLRFVSIPRLAREGGSRFGRREAFVDRGRRLDFVDVSEATVASTRAALAAGVQRGTRAAIWAPNSLEWMLAALGVMGAGGTVIPVNTRFKGDEAAYVIERGRAEMLFTVTDFLGTDHAAMLRTAGTPASLREVVVLDGPVATGDLDWVSYLDRGGRVSPSSADASIDDVRGEDIADVLFTSGTTGRPKGVPTTHAQNLRAFFDYTGSIGLVEGDRYLIVNPFFHAFGYKAGWLGCLLRGATAFPLPVFDVDTVMRTIEREQITVLPGPPTLLQGLLDHPSRAMHDLRSLRLTVTGAASIPVELIRRLRAERLFREVLTGYGLTETSGLVSVSHRDDPPEVTATMSGRVAEGIEVRVVDDDGTPLAPDEVGELVVRGYNVMSGYDGEPVETANAIDSDGWLHTGDIGSIDARGYIRITDRKKDMFIVGGFNAYPAEIENLLLSHDAIARAAVVGAPDARLGEIGVAFVVARDRTVDEAGVIAWARGRMANFKVPRHVVVVDELPMNASGKVVKEQLRARARELVTARATT